MQQVLVLELALERLRVLALELRREQARVVALRPRVPRVPRALG